VRGQDASQLIAEAQIHNITLLAASDEITWQHLDSISAHNLGIIKVQLLNQHQALEMSSTPLQTL
jgi:hypothetical protein